MTPSELSVRCIHKDGISIIYSRTISFNERRLCRKLVWFYLLLVDFCLTLSCILKRSLLHRRRVWHNKYRRWSLIRPVNVFVINDLLPYYRGISVSLKGKRKRRMRCCLVEDFFWTMEVLKTKSFGKLSNSNFQWVKTLYQNIFKHIAFFFRLFKGYKCNKLSEITPKKRLLLDPEKSAGKANFESLKFHKMRSYADDFTCVFSVNVKFEIYFFGLLWENCLWCYYS